MDSATQAEHSGRFRRALDEGDANELWKIWSHVMPHLPQPKTLTEATIIMHRARTEADSIHDNKRCYSHSWLIDHGFPSGLPDRLKPLADRLYPKIVKAVGISVNMPKIFKGIESNVQKVMSDAVEEMHADGVDLDDRQTVHKLMFERREQELRSLGIIKRPKDYTEK